MAKATASQAVSPTPLTFPAPIFAALSPAPFLAAHLTSATPVRPNGRTTSAFRSPTVNTGSLTHCHGSAVVRIGDTSVVCGVRGEILLASDIAHPPNIEGKLELPTDSSAELLEENEDASAAELAHLGLLVPNLELSTGCNPHNLPGNPPSVAAQSLSQRLLALLHSTRLVRTSDLRILHTPKFQEDGGEVPDAPPEAEIKAYWTLYIDIVFIGLDGGAFDTAWAAILAALRDTRLPRAYWDDDAEMILCDDDPKEAKTLRLRGLPVATSFAVFNPPVGMGEERRAWVLADPDDREERLCPEHVTVVVDCEREKKIRRIEKHGGGIVGKGEMAEIVKRAEERWKEWRDILW